MTDNPEFIPFNYKFSYACARLAKAAIEWKILIATSERGCPGTDHPKFKDFVAARMYLQELVNEEARKDNRSSRLYTMTELERLYILAADAAIDVDKEILEEQEQ